LRFPDLESSMPNREPDLWIAQQAKKIEALTSLLLEPPFAFPRPF